MIDGIEIDYTKPHPCHSQPCEGLCTYVDDDYGSLGSGGSFERWKCTVCGKITRIAMGD